MKNKNLKNLMTIILLWAVVGTACTEEDEYTKFLEGGEIYYPGKIENAFVLPGKGRVRLYGHFISDPKVTQCLVYWNIRQDSIIFPVTRQNIVDTLDEVISIEEGIHNFEFITMDDKGNRSVIVNVTGQSYGDKFLAQLNNRPVIDTIYTEASNELQIEWGGMDLSTGAYETEVQYNLGSNVESVRVDIEETMTTISNYDGTGVKYRTFFRPSPYAIDVFWTEFVTLDVE